jgi:hypothetical protein
MFLFNYSKTLEDALMMEATTVSPVDKEEESGKTFFRPFYKHSSAKWKMKRNDGSD